MAQWNGKEISSAAHRIALEIKKISGHDKFPSGYNIADVKSQLRRFYVATGGKRGKGGYEPSAREYRRLYNGSVTGADLLSSNGGTPAKPDKPAKPAKGAAKPVDSSDPVAALKAILGGDIDSDAVKQLALDTTNGRLGEVLANQAELIEEAVAKAVRKVEISVADAPAVAIDTAHKALERVLRYAANRKAVILVGPAGSGKTTLAEQVAEALKLPFYMSGKCVDEVKITGYMDGGGTYRTTAFRKAYEEGGLFLFDEIDGWSPDALVAVNAPLAGKWGDFPDGMVKRHPDFVPIAAANTYGRGADRQYVGREQLDAATLDRFGVIEIDYDEDLELAISPDREWTKFCQKVRKACDDEKVRHIVSPRASIAGGEMLAAGDLRADVEETYVWRGMEEVTKNRILAAMR